MVDKIVEILLVLVLVGATLAFGGVQPITYSLAEGVLFLAVLLLVAKQTREGRIRLPLPVWPLVFAGWAALALVPLSPAWVARVSPARLLEPEAASLAVNLAASVPLSVDTHDTALALVKFLAYICAFILAAYVFDFRKGKSNLVRALVFLGCLEAVYGIVQYLTGWQQIFTYTKEYDLEEATGTYINRNHFAGLLEMTIPFVLATGFYYVQLAAERRHTREVQASGAPSSPGSRAIYYFFWVVIMVVAVIFSRSRAGILATLFSLLFIALLAQLKIARKVWMLGVFFFLVCVVGYGMWIGLDPVLARFEKVGDPEYLALEGRTAAWKGGLQMVQDYPWTGTGLGTFRVAYRRYQTTHLENVFDHAHNDYLQLAIETGLIGAVLVFGPIFYLFGRMLLSFLSDDRRYHRSITLGCLGSTLGLLIHSLTDFNLQIPANAMIFAAVLGIGYKAACIEGDQERSARSPEVRRVPGRGPRSID